MKKYFFVEYKYWCLFPFVGKLEFNNLRELLIHLPNKKEIVHLLIQKDIVFEEVFFDYLDVNNENVLAIVLAEIDIRIKDERLDNNFIRQFNQFLSRNYSHNKRVWLLLLIYSWIGFIDDDVKNNKEILHLIITTSNVDNLTYYPSGEYFFRLFVTLNKWYIKKDSKYEYFIDIMRNHNIGIKIEELNNVQSAFFLKYIFDKKVSFNVKEDFSLSTKIISWLYFIKRKSKSADIINFCDFLIKNNKNKNYYYIAMLDRGVMTKEDIIQMESWGYPNLVRDYNIPLPGYEYHVYSDILMTYLNYSYPKEFKGQLSRFLKTRNKRLINVMFMYSLRTSNYNYFYVSSLLSELDIDNNLKANLIERLSSNKLFFIDKTKDVNTIKYIVLLLRQFVYNGNRIVDLIYDYLENKKDYEYDNLYCMDIKSMLEELLSSDVNIKKIIGKKPKSFNEIHDRASTYLTKLKTPKFYLKQDFLYELDNTMAGEFIIKIPKTNYDLIDIGLSLNNCVGNGSYAKNIFSHKLFVITLSKDNKVVWCISLNNRFDIREISGINNKKAGEAVFNLINEIDFSKYIIFVE